MIPVLYEKTEKTMTSWGLGQIVDCQKAVVTEELNGDFTAEMIIPYTSPVYPLLLVDRIVKLAAPNGAKQPFRIVSISKPMAGLVTVKMEHVSAQLKKVIMKRWVDRTTSGLPYITRIPHVGSLDDFSFDIRISGFSTEGMTAFPAIKTPMTCREYLQGKEGSMADTYHCEWIFNGWGLSGFGVTAVDRRGEDRGLRIRYGYNMADLKQDESIANVWTGLYVYWKKEVDGVEQYVAATDAAYSQYAGYYAFERIQSMDVSNEFETQPTAAQLLAWAQSYVDRNNYGVPAVSVTVDFKDVTESLGYEGPWDQSLYLGDTVHIDYAALGIDLAARVQKYTYDSIHEKYLTVDVGTVKPSITKSLAAVFRETGVKIR